MNEAVLVLEGLVLRVKVGCSREERAKPAALIFDFALRFKRPPRACRTDDLNDTVCYAHFSELTRKRATGKEFKLIEHLGTVVYETLRAELPRGCELAVRVSKRRPPIPGVEGAARFITGAPGLVRMMPWGGK